MRQLRSHTQVLEDVDEEFLVPRYQDSQSHELLYRDLLPAIKKLMLTTTTYRTYSMLVLSPYPTPKGGKGLGTLAWILGSASSAIMQCPQTLSSCVRGGIWERD